MPSWSRRRPELEQRVRGENRCFGAQANASLREEIDERKQAQGRSRSRA